MKISLPIDTKSLFINIFNDNDKGHTATVATNIKQGKTINHDLEQVFRIPNQINFQKYENLTTNLTKNSKSKTIIRNVFTFKNITVNGHLINNSSTFCMFVKEEVDKEKHHFGRLKLHYPLTLKHEEGEININNREIFSLISDYLGGYAFVVTSFDFDFKKEILNFNCEIVGERGIPYSKVFINNKGVGNKYNDKFYEFFDNYDIESPIIRTKMYGEVDSENYIRIITDRKDKIIENEVTKQLKIKGFSRIVHLSKRYPYALYDVEAYLGDTKYYFVVATTASSNVYFDLSMAKFRFLEFFRANARVICVTHAFDVPKLSSFSFNELQESFKRKINSMRFFYE